MHFHSLLSLTCAGALLLQGSAAAVINRDSTSDTAPWKGRGHINVIQDGQNVGCVSFYGYFVDDTAKCQTFVPKREFSKPGKFTLGFPNRETRFASMDLRPGHYTMFCGHMPKTAWNWKGEGAYLINPYHSRSNNSITTWYLNDDSDDISSLSGDHNVYLQWESVN